MSRKVINNIISSNSNTVIFPKINLEASELASPINLLDESIALQKLGMPLSMFFDNREKYIGVIFEITENSEGAVSISKTNSTALQLASDNSTEAFYVMCPNSPLAVSFSVYIIYSKETNTFEQAEIIVTPNEE